MLNLHQAVDETRAVLKWGGIIIGVALLFLFLYKGGSLLYTIFAPPPPPTVSFGKLPIVTFPQSKITQKLSYNVDTITGTLPNLPDRSTVNKIIQPEPNILSLQRAQQKVENVGFLSSGVSLSTSVYQWNDTTDGLAREFIADILTFNFTMSSSFLQNDEVIKALDLPEQQQAIKVAKEFLENLESYPKDIDDAKTKTTLLATQEGKLVTADSFSNAQIIRVDFYQKNVNDLPIRYPDFPQSVMNFYVASGDFDGRVVQAEYVHHNISDTSATYPIKTTEEALSELENGGGYVVSFDGTNKDVNITKVYLGYYLGRLTSLYLMPIIIFEGKNNFVAYVSAVKNEWVGK